MTLKPNELPWKRMTMPGQFLLAGAVVMIAAALGVGSWVSNRIEQAVVQNSAVAAAHFMESFISPLSQELAHEDTLSTPARRALEEIFEGTPVGERVVSYKIWKTGGRIVHASDETLIGQTFQLSDNLRRAWSGTIGAAYKDLNDPEDQGEAALGVPLLEVYSPIHEVWTGEVIAVAEFYERADGLDKDLTDARRKSWLVVGSAFLASGILLFGIVQAGGRTIRNQRELLEKQLAETRSVSEQNLLLRQRAVSASSRATAQADRTLRQVGFDLHDGPAQYLALAALRLDGALPDSDADHPDAAEVRRSLNKALMEIRAISRGLALPDLDTLDLRTLVARAVDDHNLQTGMSIEAAFPDNGHLSLDYTQKLCIYRFLQETLSNVYRHADMKRAAVRVESNPGRITVSVSDDGPGFDPQSALRLRSDGGQGLLGLHDRAESIGGEIVMSSRPGGGTTLTLSLPVEEESR